MAMFGGDRCCSPQYMQIVHGAVADRGRPADAADGRRDDGRLDRLRPGRSRRTGAHPAVPDRRLGGRWSSGCSCCRCASADTAHDLRSALGDAGARPRARQLPAADPADRAERGAADRDRWCATSSATLLPPDRRHARLFSGSLPVGGGCCSSGRVHQPRTATSRARSRRARRPDRGSRTVAEGHVLRPVDDRAGPGRLLVHRGPCPGVRAPVQGRLRRVDGPGVPARGRCRACSPS